MPFDKALEQWVPWNKGKLVGHKSPLKPQQVWAIRVRLQLAGKKRDLALFNLAIDSKLRGCDLLSLCVSDLRIGAEIRSRAKIVQSKTGNAVQFEVTKQTRDAIEDWCAAKSLNHHDWLVPSRKDRTRHLSTWQYGRVVESWIRSIGLPRSSYATHTMRRTKATLIYRKTGNLRAVQLLLGHTKIDSTVRYLGVEVEDALALAESIYVNPTHKDRYCLHLTRGTSASQTHARQRRSLHYELHHGGYSDCHIGANCSYWYSGERIISIGFAAALLSSWFKYYHVMVGRLSLYVMAVAVTFEVAMSGGISGYFAHAVVALPVMSAFLFGAKDTIVFTVFNTILLGAVILFDSVLPPFELDP